MPAQVRVIHLGVCVGVGVHVCVCGRVHGNL